MDYWHQCFPYVMTLFTSCAQGKIISALILTFLVCEMGMVATLSILLLQESDNGPSRSCCL